MEAGRESRCSISCAVCNCDLGRGSDFKYTNGCGIPFRYLWGWIFVGYFVLSHDEVMDRLEKCWLPLTVCAVILAVVFTVMYWGRPYAEHSVLDTPLCSLFAWIAVIAALAFMKKWGDISNTLTRWMAAKSWGLYLFHYLFIAMTAYYLTMYTKLPAVLLYLFVAAAGFAGAYLAYEIIRRIPVLRWIVCGIGGKKNNVCRKSHSASETKSYVAG